VEEKGLGKNISTYHLGREGKKKRGLRVKGFLGRRGVQRKLKTLVASATAFLGEGGEGILRIKGHG